MELRSLALLQSLHSHPSQQSQCKETCTSLQWCGFESSIFWITSKLFSLRRSRSPGIKLLLIILLIYVFCIRLFRIFIIDYLKWKVTRKSGPHSFTHEEIRMPHSSVKREWVWTQTNLRLDSNSNT